MIYVCRVDTGSRHIFDLADGIENVGSLANAIEKQFRIEKTKQILLISGGEVLDDYQRKFYGFGFGCEESPIYLIDKANVEKREPPCIDTQLNNLNSQDFKQDIQSAILLKPSFQTLQIRSQLTHRVNELDKVLNKHCQSLYEEQFWQYQGYMALVANLDDYVSSFRKKEQTVRDQFDTYFNNVNNYKELMKDIHKYINVLSNIRLLPNLINDQQLGDNSSSQIYSPSSKRLNNLRANLFSSISSQSISNIQTSTSCPETVGEHSQSPELNKNNTLTLLDWIKSTDPNNKLNSVIDETREILENFDKNFKWNELNAKITKLLNQVENNQQMREIEGLTKRLEDLKCFLDESNKFLINQNEITESLKSNFERATTLRDESVLHDLCKAHERQLEVFKQNHSNILEITMKINKAKLELIRVIHSRLHWIMQVQKQIADYDFQVQIYFKQLRRLNVRLKLMEQLKKAPYVYIYSMKETLRRISFSNTYKSFAKLFYNLVNNVYENEMKQRKLFDSKTASLNQHFVLNILFRSLFDKVEPFMNEIKLDFDGKLPNLNETEVNLIETEIINYFKNEITTKIPTENSAPVTKDSNDRTSSTSTDTSSSSSSSSANNSTSATSSSATPSSESITSTCLSSTTNNLNDNEIFLIKELNINIDEKLKRTSLSQDFNKDLLRLNKFIQLFSNINENDNENYSNELNNKLKKSESTNTDQSQVDTEMLRDHIRNLRFKLNETKSMINNYQSEMNSYLFKLIDFNSKKFDQNINNKENEVLSNITKNQESKSTLYSNYLDLINKLLDENQNIDDFNFDQDEEDKQFITTLLDKLKKYKTDQDSKLNELKQNIDKLKKNINAENQIKFNEAIKRVATEKDKQIEELKNKQNENLERINSLKFELDKLKEKISQPSDLISNQAQLDSNNISNDILLSSDPNETKSKLREIMLQEKINQLQKQLSMFTTLPLTNNYYETVQLNSCNLDDLVLAVYSEEYCSYKIIHKTSNYLHFVYSAVFKNCEQKLSLKNSCTNICKQNSNSEFSSSPMNDQNQMEVQFTEQSITNISNNTNFINNNNNNNNITSSIVTNEMNLQLSPSSKNLILNNSNQTNQGLNETAGDQNLTTDNNMFLGDKQPQWFIGKVLVKEFCVARKENNRFKVPSGTRFYRVKLKPYNLF